MKYLICVTNRVGSTWLCSMLQSTGIAGRPAEHFNVPEERWPHFAAQYRRLTQQHDPLGIKTAYGSLMRAIEYVGEAEFTGVPCIWLKRNDTLAQAISNYRAMQTGQWMLTPGEVATQPSARPDRDAILTLQAEYEHCNRVLWPAWFTSHNVRPFELEYERMQQAPEQAVRDICNFLGLGTPTRIDTGATRVQRDATNARWREAMLKSTT